jgi:N-acetylneuraminate synthase
MRIGSTAVGDDTVPYVIAEIGVNHENDIDLAKQMITEIAEAGGNAAKFQSYKAERLASRHSPAYWDRSKEPAESQFALFKRFDKFGEAEYRELAETCGAVGIDFLSTPFDLEAVEFLAPLVPAFKVASADITNLPLLKAVAMQEKPVILSTGASTLEEIKLAVDFLSNHGAPEVAPLHCVLAYPTAPADANLGAIPLLKEEYPTLIVGYSDHVPPDDGMLVLASAYLLGARIIEKHYTFDKTRPGNDHYHAMDKNDLRMAERQFVRFQELYGRREKVVLDAEKNARTYARRSLVAARPRKAGHRLTHDDLAIKRPGTGIPPTEINRVVGMILTRDVEEDVVLTDDMMTVDTRGDAGTVRA